MLGNDGAMSLNVDVSVVDIFLVGGEGGAAADPEGWHGLAHISGHNPKFHRLHYY